MDPAVSGPAARPGRAGRRAARGGRHRAGDDLAGLPGRAAGPAAQAARRADRPRRAGLAGQRDRLGAGHERRCGQQRPAARPGDHAVAPAAAARRMVGPRAERAGARAARAVHRRARASRRRGGHRARRPGPPDHHAAQPLDLRRASGDRAAYGKRGRDGRLAPVPGGGQPDAGRRELPAQARRHPVPCVQARCHPRRGGPDRRDHHVRRGAVPGLRAGAHAVSDTLAGVLEHVTVTRYVTPLREGGSLPALVEADNFGTYVMKFRGAGQGPLALVAEIIAGELARRLGLRVPELVFAELDPQIADTEPDEEIQDLLRASEGTNLGVDFLPGAAGFDPLGWTAPDDFATELLWFDALVQNVDRTWRNPNLLVWHQNIWLIDHGAALY